MDLVYEMNRITDGEWFLSGSLALGVGTKNSDIDICIPIWHKESIEDWLKANNCKTRKDSDYFSGFKVSEKVNGFNGIMDINFIPLHPRDFLSWAMSTRQQASQLFDLSVLYSGIGQTFANENKRGRVADFELLCSINKRNIPEFEYQGRFGSGVLSLIWSNLKNLEVAKSTSNQPEVAKSTSNQPEVDIPF